MTERKLQVAVAAVVLVAAGWFARSARAQEESGTVWEFATVESFPEYLQGTVKYSTANICYHTTAGCRWDTIRTATDRWGQINDALAAATARLGERGWEPVSVTPSTETHRPTVMLKRIRPAQ